MRWKTKHRLRRFNRLLHRFIRDQHGAWWIWLLVGLALSIVSYLIMPKTQADKPQAASDLDDPTADSGRPVPVVFGTVTVKGLNILWYGEKSKQTKTIKV
jgi:hypothetical protein